MGVLPVAGRVVTGDAMFAHRDVAEAIRDGGGDYALIVKDNQPELRTEFRSALHAGADFPRYQRKRKAALEQQARTADKGHGRRELKHILSTTP